MKKIYLDYAATTPLDPQVFEAMLPYFTQKFGNPSSLHQLGREAKEAIEKARQQVAMALNCLLEEVFFTGTTTISDNLALLGAARALEESSASLKSPSHLVVSAIEHHAILEVVHYLQNHGWEVTYLQPDSCGQISPESVTQSLRPHTRLISIMMANNEVGTVQPIAKIANILISQYPNISISRPVFHTDAAAVVDYLDLDVRKLGIDMLSLGAHKFGGPKGVGTLFVKKGTPIKPLLFGGHQEKDLWPGTESVPLIVGLGQALEIAQKEQQSANWRVKKLRDLFIEGILKTIPGAILTGHPTERLSDIASFIFPGVEGESLLLRLDKEGIACATGSACTSADLEPSHVLLAMGIPKELAHCSIRFSLGKQNTKEEINYVLKTLPKIIANLRAISTIKSF